MTLTKPFLWRMAKTGAFYTEISLLKLWVSE